MNKYRYIPLIGLLILILVASMLSISVSAKTVSVLDGLVSIADSANTISASGNNVTATAKGNLFSKGTNNLTITNNSGSKAQLSFDYTAQSANSFSIAGSTASTSGSYRVPLENGGTLSISIKSNNGLSNTTATLTLSNITLTIVKDSSNVTFVFDNTLGGITVGGESVSSGAVKNISGSTGVALVAAPASGVSFLGWTDADGKILSTDAAYTLLPAQDTTIRAAFAKNGGTPWFGVGTATQQTERVGLLSLSELNYYTVGNPVYLFDDFNSAAQAAANSTNKTMVLMNSGTLPSGTYTIPSGVTLLIPFDSSNTMYTTQSQATDDTDSKGNYIHKIPKAYRILTLDSGANLVINGAMSISAKHKRVDSGVSGGAPHDYVGWVAMNDGSLITINNGGALYAYGYITGSGTVTANSGSTTYEMFQVEDFRGGTASTDGGMKDNKVFPLTQYYFQNIEVPMTVMAGAKVYGFTTIWMSSSKFPTGVLMFGGNSDTAMFKLSDGYVIKQYNGTEDRLDIELNANFSVNNLVIDVGTTTVNSKDYVLPINNMNMTLKSGKTCTVTQHVAFLPGTTFHIEEGATMSLADGCYAVIYDLDNWGTYCYGAGKDETFRPVTYAPGRHSDTKRTLFDSTWIVNGTLSGAVYTTGAGANIYSTNLGTVIINPGESTLSTTYQYKQTATIYDPIAVTLAKLKNGNGDYVSTSAGTYVYHPDHKKWALTAHTLTDTVTAPTCTAQGYTTHTCTCGYSYTDNETAALGHAEVSHDAKAPTCTESGWDAYVTCSRCDYTTYKEKTAIGHSYGAVTYSGDGITSYTATRTCTREGCAVDSADHSQTVSASISSVVTKPATCQATGIRTYTADFSVDWAVDKTTEDTIAVDANAHTWTNATCTAPKTCSVCGATDGEALGHTPGAEATCTDPQKCTVCQAELASAKGHTPGAEATCTTAQTCTVCGTELTAALGHKDVNKDHTCDNGCGVYQGTHADSNTDGDHVCDYGCGAVLEEHTPGAAATCTTAQTCTVCGAELAAALGHSMTHHEAVAPGCETDGTVEYWSCSQCSKNFGDADGEAVLNSIVDAATGHSSEYIYDNNLDGTHKVTRKCCGVVVTANESHTYGENNTCVCGQIGTFTITWIVNGVETQETYIYNSTPSFKGTTTKAYNETYHYTFSGWDKDIAPVTENATYTAVFSAEAHVYDEGVVTTVPTFDATGVKTFTCGCGHSYTETVAQLIAVAQIGETKYQTLADALAAGGEVTLLANIETDAALVINNTVVLNLNGFGVKTTDEDTNGDGVFHVVAGGDLTINGEGVINGVGGNNYCIAIWADGGKVTINGGTYTNVGAGEDNQYDLIYVKNGGEVIINGGTFIAQTPAWTLNCHDASYRDGNATITVNGGKFWGFNPYNNKAEGEGTNFVVTGSHAMDADGDGYYTIEKHSYSEVVTDPDFGQQGYTTHTCACGHSYKDSYTDALIAVAQIGETKYQTLAEAIEAAEAGDTVELLTNVELTGITVVPEGVTLDFNGKTLKGTVLGKLSLHGGTLVTAEGYVMAGPNAHYYQTTDAVLILSVKDAQNASLCDVELVSGTLTVVPDEWWTGVGQTMIIREGATFEIPAGKVMQVLSTVIVEGNAIIEGTVNLYIADAVITAPAGLKVTTTAGETVWYTGGKYVVHNHSYDEGVYTEPTVYRNGFKTYTCECKHSYEVEVEDTMLPTVVMIDDNRYATLDAAIADAKDGDTIVLQKNVDLGTAAVTIPEGVTLDLNRCSIKGDVSGTLKINRGTYYTAQNYKMMGSDADAYYQTTDAVLTMIVPNGDITVHSGTLTLTPEIWWTLPGQTLTIEENAAFVIPEGKTLNVLSEVVVEGTVTVGGTVNLYTADATVAYKDNSLLDKFAHQVGDKVLYVGGKYVVHSHTAGQAVVENFDDADYNNEGSYDSVIYCNDAACGAELSRETIEIPVKAGVASINGFNYGTLAEAIAAAKQGENKTIVLIGKYIVTGTETWELDGITLEISAIDGNYGVVVKGDLTINGGTFVVNGTYGIGVTGTLTVNGGTFKVAGDNDYLIGNWGSTTITGGEFIGQYSCVNNFAGTTEIKGGTFTTAATDSTGEYDSSDVMADTGLTITGGTFSKNVNDYCADGYGLYMVDEAYVVHRHTEVIDEAVAPDCTNTGLTEGSHCSVCNEVLVKQETVAALGHTAGEVVVENEIDATCTEAGSYDHAQYCTVCGNEAARQTIVVPAKGHTAGDAIVENRVDVTCTTDGSYDNVVHCSVCDATISSDHVVVPATGHTEIVDKAVAPTCIAAGKTEGKHCSVCSEVLVAQEVVPATGHGGKPTMNEQTAERHLYTYDCCGEIAFEGKHEWKDGVCTVCAYICEHTYDNNCDETCNHECGFTRVPPHDYDQGAVTTAPTCTEAGVKTFTCSCGDTYTEAIKAKGHTLTQVEAKEPTCTEAGYEAYEKCSVCGYTTIVEIPAKGHDYQQRPEDGYLITEATCTKPAVYHYSCSICGASDESRTFEYGQLAEHCVVTDNAVDPDCTNTGLTEGKHCSVCDKVLVAQETVDALGHTDEIIPYVPATCTTAGSTEGLKCSVCGEVRVAVDVIPALGHTEIVDQAVAPTCTATGLTEGKHCGTCGETIVAQETVDALGHNYVDGKCACGEKDPNAEAFVPKFGTTVETNEGDNNTLVTTFKAGTNISVAPTVTITSPEGGWKRGEENVFTVASDGDVACVVIVKNGDTYTRLTATTTGDVHSFTHTFTDDCEIIVAVKGDVDFDGELTGSEVIQIKAAQLGKLKTFSKLQIAIADLDGDGELTGSEVIQIKAAQLSKLKLAW